MNELASQIPKFLIFIYQTLLTFLGRGPLCGIGVASLMEIISNPWLIRDLIAESRPPPIPLTITSTAWGPLAFNFSAMAAITLEEAKGVAFFGPENPREPAVAQARTLPARSVTVITVLL